MIEIMDTGGLTEYDTKLIRTWTSFSLYFMLIFCNKSGIKLKT